MLFILDFSVFKRIPIHIIVTFWPFFCNYLASQVPSPSASVFVLIWVGKFKRLVYVFSIVNFHDVAAMAPKLVF